MAAVSFEAWLSDKLKSLNVDPDIFGSYIQSILDGDETEIEKRDALQGIFDEDIGNDQLFDEILIQFNKLSKANVNTAETSLGDLDAKLSRIMEEQAKSVVCESQQLTSEEKHLRQVILNQYGQISDGEDEYEDDDPGGHDGATNGLLSRNTNAETVSNAEREKREKSKGEHEKKKAQDKLNREKQKQQQQDRKDKEKKRTQKGERKR